jgi:hypothetical protein
MIVCGRGNGSVAERQGGPLGGREGTVDRGNARQGQGFGRTVARAASRRWMKDQCRAMHRGVTALQPTLVPRPTPVRHGPRLGAASEGLRTGGPGSPS